MQEIYLFDATVQGNGRATTGITPQKLKGTSARLIWQTGTAVRAVVCDVGYNGRQAVDLARAVKEAGEQC